MESITDLNRRTSRLLRLPGEIRNQIFSYLLDSTDLISIDDKRRNGYGRNYWTGLEIHFSEILAMTMVCRQLREETQRRLFQNSKLFTRCSGDALVTMPASISALVTKLHVDLGWYHRIQRHTGESFWDRWTELEQLPRLEKMVVVQRSADCERPLLPMINMFRWEVKQKDNMGKSGVWATYAWNIRKEYLHAENFYLHEQRLYEAGGVRD
ncbi:hypothetical protein HBI56_161050 [Parastagonospora nodorum]|nr:hypothetical protein HBI10_185800 [Parastagonospora nodorum]KAH4014357.1 hypothetical protein HBI13_173210 [Parastagonospora nodorum]KAH4206859.1 hypothetical protein HBI95_121650 [Parastagonospora nodorum]KAH4908818.1 hypothetical protein HBH74_173650 [Parastagonospora nodorum]KAH4926068.1 hypothetical protein HBH73_206400 [Parastagonospora nodorum]